MKMQRVTPFPARINMSCTAWRHSSRASHKPIEFFNRCRLSSATRSQAKKTTRPRSPVNHLPVKPTDYESTAAKLAKKATPTLLYQSNSHVSYIVGCYIIGGGLVCMGTFNGYTNYIIPESELLGSRKVPGYVPTFVNVGAVFLIAAGAFICIRVRHQSIVDGQFIDA